MRYIIIAALALAACKGEFRLRRNGCVGADCTAAATVEKNYNFSLDALSDYSVKTNVPKDVVLPLSTDGAPDGTLTVTSTSDDQSLIPNENLVVTTADGKQTLTLNPKMNRSGSTTVRVSVSDGKKEIVQKFSATLTDRTWAHPASVAVNISPDGSAASNIAAAVSANGDAVVAWLQSSAIFKSHRRNGVWTHPSSLTDYISLPALPASNVPAVAMDKNGNAIIIWRQNDGSNPMLYKAEFRNGTWTLPSTVNDRVSFAGNAVARMNVAMGDNGDAIIVWEQSNGAVNRGYKAEYRNGVWSYPAAHTDAFTPAGNAVSAPHPAMNNKGETLITWHQDFAGVTRIFKSEYRNGAWTHPSSAADSISAAGLNHQFAKANMDNNGNALICWYGNNGTANATYKSEYRNGAWTNPSSAADYISFSTNAVLEVSCGLSNSGDAVITWRQHDGTRFQLMRAYYHNGTWTLPTSLTETISPTAQPINDSSVTIDGFNNGVAVWRQTNGTFLQIYKAEYHDGTWYPPTLADNVSPSTSAVEATQSPVVVSGYYGDYLVLWIQSDGSNNQVLMSEFK